MLAFVFVGSFPATAAPSEKALDNAKLSEMFNGAVSQYQQDLKNGKQPDVKYANLTDPSGNKYLVKAFRYKDQNEKLDENTYTQTYVMSNAKEYVQPATSDGKPIMSAFYTLPKAEYEPTGTVLFSITLTYNRNYVGDYLLTNVSGGWSIVGTGTTLSNLRVTYAGYDLASYYSQWDSYPTAYSFNYNTGYTRYVNSDAAGSVMGASTHAHIKHGTSSEWEWDFKNVLFDNGGFFL